MSNTNNLLYLKCVRQTRILAAMLLNWSENDPDGQLLFYPYSESWGLSCYCTTMTINIKRMATAWTQGQIVGQVHALKFSVVQWAEESIWQSLNHSYHAYKSCRTYLTNHIGSIIMSPVVNSLRGRHTCTQTRIPDFPILRNQAHFTL